jgi:hypothetical protein
MYRVASIHSFDSEARLAGRFHIMVITDLLSGWEATVSTTVLYRRDVYIL